MTVSMSHNTMESYQQHSGRPEHGRRLYPPSGGPPNYHRGPNGSWIPMSDFGQLRNMPRHFQERLPEFRSIPQQFNSRIHAPNLSQMQRPLHNARRQVSDINLPKQREVIIDNIKTSIPKVNNFLCPPNLTRNTIKQSDSNKTDQKKKKRRIGSYTLGSGVFAGGLLMFLLFDPMVSSVLDFMFQLKPGGLLTDVAWTKNPIPISSCWYLFSIKNPHQFLEGAKPFLEEKGPVCYDIYRIRNIVEWTDQTVKFNERFEFVFNEERSVSRDIRVDILNLPIVAAVMTARNIMTQYYVSFLGPFVYNAISAALRMTGEDIVTQITARQLMEGWKLNIISYIDAIMRPFRAIGIPLPDFKEGFLGIVDHSFSVTGTVSYFEIGPFEQYIKTENGHTAGDVFQFQDNKVYPPFKAPCNRFGGSDGLIWPRPLTKRVSLYIYHLCRQIYLIYNQTHYFQGTITDRYTLDPHMFDMSEKRNRCFCVPERDWKDCDGWTSIGPCLFNVALGISFPHFCNSPRRLREVDGLNPDPEKHFGFVEFEKNLAVPALAKITLQGVIPVEAVSSVSVLSKLPTVKLPVAWVEIYGGADTALLASVLFVGSNGVRYGSYGFLLGGLGLSGLFFARGIMKGRKPKQLEDD